MNPAAQRPAVGQYAWPGAFGAQFNRWPFWSIMDHAWYAGVSHGDGSVCHFAQSEVTKPPVLSPGLNA